jgi:hypothetical protein
MVDLDEPPVAVSAFKLRLAAGDLVGDWAGAPGLGPVRIYGEADVSLARQAREGSPTAFRECSGSSDCRFVLPTADLLFFQAVTVCSDGATEGPN